jgi:hypothetical protein
MPYKLVRDDKGYYVVSPHGHYLSKHPLSHEQAKKQETAVRLTELRKEHPHYAPALAGKQHSEEQHVHKMKEEKEHHSGHLDALGLPFVPAPRDAVHKHGIIKTSDIFAPLPLPLHHLRGTGQKYSSHG